MKKITRDQKQIEDITPEIADQIGEWTSRRPTPLDILSSKDEASALKLAYEMVATYREMTQMALAQLDRQTELNRKLTERLRQVLDA